MEDCDNFRGMVEKKNFVTIFVDIETDALYKEDIVLNLVLIDTSTPEDVYIGEELINAGVAVEVK